MTYLVGPMGSASKGALFGAVPSVDAHAVIGARFWPLQDLQLRPWSGSWQKGEELLKGRGHPANYADGSDRPIERNVEKPACLPDQTSPPYLLSW